jgi:hypothetical protein
MATIHPCPLDLAPTSDRRRLSALSAAILFAVGCSGAVSELNSASPPSGFDGEANQLLVEDVRLNVYGGESLRFRVRAESGRIDQETWIVRTEGPTVEMFDEAGQVRQSFQGRHGELWPVTETIAEADGGSREATHYDWLLVGGVSFTSEGGRELQSERLRFNGDAGKIVSDIGVSYRLPMGPQGTVLAGSSDRIEATIDAETGAIVRWELIGNIQLTSESQP